MKITFFCKRYSVESVDNIWDNISVSDNVQRESDEIDSDMCSVANVFSDKRYCIIVDSDGHKFTVKEIAGKFFCSAYRSDVRFPVEVFFQVDGVGLYDRSGNLIKRAGRFKS